MDPAAVLHERFAAAITEAFGVDGDPVIRPSTNDRFGHFQANAAMGLAKQLGKTPREVAEAIVAAVGLEGVATKTEIAGPGFVNVWLEDDFLVESLAGVGVPAAASPEVYVIDYSHPNVAKEMHVGHLRSTIIGDALARMLEAQGHRVVRHNHIGDWGTPFGMLIEHLLDIGETEAAHELSVGDLTAFYQAARVKFDGDAAFADRARSRVVLLQGGDAETLRLWHLLVEESERYFATVYDRLGVTLSEADLRGESAYNAMLETVATDLEATGLARIDDGALCAFPPGFDIPLIVRKSDEGYGYQATDLAAIRYRINEVGADHLLYVVDAGQALHLAMAFAVAEQAGWLPPGRAEHIVFGLVLGEDGKRLKTRAGKPVKLIDLLDEAVERAEAVVAEKSPDMPADERAAVARAVGIGAVKYADLSSDRVKDYTFDLDRMLAMDGNTGPYLQYAGVRIRSIQRRADAEGATRGPLVIGDDAERALVLELLGFGAAVNDAVTHRQPHRLCGYLFDLSQAFTAFFERCPVLRAEDEATRASRLTLCELTAQVLARGLGLLGIAVPERM